MGLLECAPVAHLSTAIAGVRVEMIRKAFLAIALSSLLSGCAPGIVRTVPEEDGPRLEVGILAARLSLDAHRDPLSRLETLSNDANEVVLCPGMASVRVNDAVFHLPGVVTASSRGLLVPASAEALIRMHLRTPPPTVPERRPDPGSSGSRSSHRWSHIRTPGIPRSWRVAANRQWTSIVIHHSATEVGGAERFDKTHREENGWTNGLGYHFVIGNGTDTGDGQIEVGPRWRRQNEGIHGAHAGIDEYNQHGIGICLVGNLEEGRPTKKQMAALLKLVRKLTGFYGIQPARIYRHQAVRPEHTDCPGRFFPMSRFLTALRK